MSATRERRKPCVPTQSVGTRGVVYVRQLLIRGLMPLLLCTLPFLAAALVLMCIPHNAVKFFLDHYGMMEVLIVGGGVALFVMQMLLCWRALRWRGTSFDEGADRWLS